VGDVLKVLSTLDAAADGRAAGFGIATDVTRLIVGFSVKPGSDRA